MKSTNFLIATIDNDFNMFKLTEDTPQFIEKIAEHTKRLEELSDGHHFYVDEMAFKALGEKSFPLRFTRVFSNNPDSLKKSTDYRIHDMKTLSDTVASKDRFSPNVQIFFIGSSEFLLKASPYAKKLLLTVVNRNNTDKLNILDKFPLNDFAKIFRKRKHIDSEMLDQIKQYRKIMAIKREKTETVIADNGMKITQEVQPQEITIIDEILNTPDYKFFEYRK